MGVQIETDGRVAVVDVTDRVAGEIPADVDRGTCTVFVRHTTAGITVNEAEPGLLEDLEAALERLVPALDGYRHDRIDDNADAHLRSILLGSAATVPVKDGRLDLGTWQSLLLVEGDGPRRRTVDVIVTPC